MTIRKRFGKVRKAIEKKGLAILRFSIAIVFLWFGALKLFPGSAAEKLAQDTISLITFETVDETLSLIILGVVECIIGLSLLFKKLLSIIIPVMYVQLFGTLLPLVLFTDQTWESALVPTLEGQYIIKNAVLIAAAILMGAVARGGKLITHPTVASQAKRKADKLERNES
jgi:uncharacterized membrane protein YkgB